MCCLFPGFNTTVTLRSHEGSLPGLPDLGRALSGIEMDFVIPNFRLPRDGDGDGDDDGDDRSPHFIKDATVITPP
jgi:hypothetical protein